MCYTGLFRGTVGYLLSLLHRAVSSLAGLHAAYYHARSHIEKLEGKYISIENFLQIPLT